MIFGFICGVIAYIGIIRFQIRLYRRNQLTQALFVLFQVAGLGLLFISGSIAFLPPNGELLIGIGISVLLWIAGFFLARWFYRKFLQHT